MERASVGHSLAVSTSDEIAATQTGAAPPPAAYPGPVLRVAADYSWRLLILGAVAYFLVQLLSKVSLAVIPFVVSLLLAALLRPLLDRLRRWGLQRGYATLATMLIAVLLLGATLTLVVIRAAQQAPQLGSEINSLLPHVKHWLIHGPLHLNPARVNNLTQTVTRDITNNSSRIATTALSTGKAAFEALGEMALAVFSTVLLLYDGERIWGFFVKGAPAALRRRVDRSGRAAWRTLSLYVRGTLIVAAFHGVVIAIALTILGVPLAFPLAVLVGLGSFVPLVGAFVTGVLAVGVAGLSKGLVAAIVVVVVLLADSQVEAHALQPFVVGRYARIHPLAVVLALTAGGILFGIFGAIIAVPVVACTNSAAQALLDQPLEGEPIPPPGG